MVVIKEITTLRIKPDDNLGSWSLGFRGDNRGNVIIELFWGDSDNPNQSSFTVNRTVFTNQVRRLTG